MSNDEAVTMTEDEKRDFMARCAKIVIPAQLVAEEPLAIMNLMSNCVVVRCEYLAMFNMFEYHAYTTLVEPLEPNQMPFEYDVNIDVLTNTAMLVKREG
jgi:hypothetical protein